jgi:hypothetical protein
LLLCFRHIQLCFLCYHFCLVIIFPSFFTIILLLSFTFFAFTVLLFLLFLLCHFLRLALRLKY